MATTQESQPLVWPRREPRPQWLERYGPPLLALFILAGTRWGSYLLPGPPYIGDVVLGLLLANAALAAAVRGSARGRIDPLLGLASGLLLLWVGIQLLFSSFTTTALRDAAPYAYAVLAFLVFPLRDRDERWVSRAITTALVFHAAWVTLAQLDPQLLTASLAGGQAQVFEVRPDIDSTVCGLLVVVALNRALLGRALFFNLFLAVWGTGVIFSFHTRAGVLAFVAQLAVLALLTRARSRAKSTEPLGRSQRHRALRARSAPAVLVVTVLLLAPLGAVAAQASVSRLFATIAPQLGTPAAVAPAGAGTAAARTAAWGHLVGWLMADPGRTMIGVGPGPDFLEQSGTAPLLLGENPIFESRQPHDYLLNTWARFGLVGLALILGVLAAGSRLAILVARWSPGLRDSDLLAVMVAITMPIPAMFGVVLEAPFGAIPFLWALGHLSARWCVLARERQMSPRIGPISRGFSAST